ncbi:MAG: hypothetical protein GTN53_01035 [Candidatus Aminicenantes bacterium]|nr:hypothetical protein [Candidatus Aminicenantes bacterium]NIQ65799.1 hypothetical protein [Candidatus Aminicenantes bacterium]NIT21081.1 hypothetical protein [Candidatus Aminicenantes bacterium]
MDDQDEFKILIGKDQVMAGHVDTIAPSFSANGTTVGIDGRDYTADLVDCSAVHEPGSFKNTTFKNMVNILLDPFLIDAVYEAEPPTDKFDFAIDSGETPFKVLDRLASKYGLLMQSNTAGQLVFIKNEFKRAETGLAAGDNVINAGATYDFTDRFSKYIIRGQDASKGAGKWAKSQPQIEASIIDPGVARYRPLLLQAETNATAASCKDRARWEATIRRARATRVNVEVKGWRQTGSDKLWEINKITNVTIPSLQIENIDLLISSIDFTKSSSGTLTRLGLVPQDSYLKEPPAPIKEKVKRQGKGRKRWL